MGFEKETQGCFYLLNLSRNKDEFEERNFYLRAQNCLFRNPVFTV